MKEGNLVVFKGTADGINVILDEEANFDEMLEHFKEKLEASTQFFKGSKVSMRFKGRLLNERQQEQLLEILAKQEAINISFVHQFENEASDEVKDWEWVKEELKNMTGSMTHFHYGIVRSGTHVEYKGNVVILGDVNPGGLVSAGGHVIVLGALKGKVRAGLDPKVPMPFVVSTMMAPIQIGIKNVIAQTPKGEILGDKEGKGLQIAYLQEEQIYVDQLDTKSLNYMLK